MDSRKRFLATAVMAAVAVSGYAQAQSVAGGGVDDLTPRQRTQFVDNAVDDVNGYVTDALDLVDKAEKAGDTLWLNCLDPKLAGLQALQSVVQSADGVYDESLVRNNYDLALQEYSKVDMAMGQANTLKTEIDACVPSSGSSHSGTGRWSSTTPGGDEDEEQYESDPSGYTRPPEASPFN
jgi:hypothetical protein